MNRQKPSSSVSFAIVTSASFATVVAIGSTARAQASVEPIPPPPGLQPAPPPPGVPPPPSTATPPPPSGYPPAEKESPKEPQKKEEEPVIGKWMPKFYGFVQLNAIEDTTQSFGVQAGNATIAKDGTYAGEHPRTTFSAAHSRFGFKWSYGEGDIKATANIEADFLGTFPSTGVSEQAQLINPSVRMRHAYFKLENPFIDLLMGQTWQLFGWQPFFHPTAVEIQGVPGQVYERNPQIRLSKTLKTEAINFDIAAAAARPPQRDSGLPDLQAGLKLTVNNWKGVRTTGATGTQVDSMAIGVSGALRWFQVQDFEAKSTHAVEATGWGVSTDAFIPVIPGTKEDKGNALTLTGSFVTGSADADFYSGLNGGITQPNLPNPTMMTPAPTFTANVDNGLVVFNTLGELTPIKWWSFIVGLQYYLPPNGRVFLAGNYSHMHSTNIAALASTRGSVFDTSNWFDGDVFIDVTRQVRLGFEYEWFEQTYGDDQKAHNSRFNLGGFYLF